MSDVNIKVIQTGQKVYRRLIRRDRRLSNNLPEVNVLEGTIVKVGRKYVYAETTWSGVKVEWKIDAGELVKQHRHSEYFLDLEQFEREQEEMEAEREIFNFTNRNMGHQINKLTLEEKRIIRDIIRNHQKEEK